MNALSLGLGLFATHEVWSRCAGTFSIISQSMTLNCFPRVRIVHTSSKVKGQIYIPEINWVLLVIGIALILGFTLTQPTTSPVNTAQLGNAFGACPPFASFVLSTGGIKKNIGSLCFPLMLSISAVAWLCCNKGCLGFSLFHFTSRTG